jgi:hypothetical protein
MPIAGYNCKGIKYTKQEVNNIEIKSKNAINLLVDEAYRQKETGTNSYRASKDYQSKITTERYLGTNG